LIALAWTVCEELRLENSNNNNSNLNNVNQGNNEFDVTDKLKDMKFMNKTVSQEHKS
jgi:hypothetical protein